MAKSRTEIQKKSDAKRGVKIKAFNLPLETIARIQEMSEAEGIHGAKLIIAMTDYYYERVYSKACE